jgi:hypothetical protein
MTSHAIQTCPMLVLLVLGTLLASISLAANSYQSGVWVPLPAKQCL